VELEVGLPAYESSTKEGSSQSQAGRWRQQVALQVLVPEAWVLELASSFREGPDGPRTLRRYVREPPEDRALGFLV